MKQIDAKLLHEITKAQLKHAVELASDDHWEHSDDGHDYLTSALRLAADIADLDFEDSIDSATKLLDEVLLNYACDGICPEIMALEPKELE